MDTETECDSNSDVDEVTKELIVARTSFFPVGDCIPIEIATVKSLIREDLGPPENCYDVIFPNLLIGDEFIATNIKKLKALSITHILNAAQGPCSYRYLDTDEIYYKNNTFKCKFLGLPLSDEPDFDICHYFGVASTFIEDGISRTRNGRVLVHSLEGTSRSATLVIAYLMICRKFSAVDAIKLVSKKRNIYPNEGFLQQICDLDFILRVLYENDSKLGDDSDSESEEYTDTEGDYETEAEQEVKEVKEVKINIPTEKEKPKATEMLGSVTPGPKKETAGGTPKRVSFADQPPEEKVEVVAQVEEKKAAVVEKTKIIEKVKIAAKVVAVEIVKPKVEDAPKPKVEDVPKPKVEETQKPKVEETQKPKVAETPKSKVEETPKPKVAETPKPKVAETPKAAEVPKPKVAGAEDPNRLRGGLDATKVIPKPKPTVTAASIKKAAVPIVATARKIEEREIVKPRGVISSMMNAVMPKVRFKSVVSFLRFGLRAPKDSEVGMIIQELVDDSLKKKWTLRSLGKLTKLGVKGKPEPEKPKPKFTIKSLGKLSKLGLVGNTGAKQASIEEAAAKRRRTLKSVGKASILATRNVKKEKPAPKKKFTLKSLTKLGQLGAGVAKAEKQQKPKKKWTLKSLTRATQVGAQLNPPPKKK